MKPFRVQQIDHVEMFVTDREEAASWYQRVLGLEVVPEYKVWATDGGPLMTSTPEGNTKLALFVGAPQASRPTVGFHRVAFRVDGASYVEFLQTLDQLALIDRHEQPVTIESVVDHSLSFSIYFSDPYGHNLELTTYDHEIVRKSLIELRDHTMDS
ncbi:MAG: VOC family protein [bacterium]|nr:VOC family protein [Candidatus Kapabacteria bacterium]